MSINVAFEKHRLSNGLDLILHRDDAIPMAAVNIWYHVGSQNEEPDRTGFAHLFEHIMFKGSKHHPHEYFMPLQEVGANVNGSTSTDRTNYYENVPSEYLELALWLESDRMGYLLDALDQASFDVEREVVKNERRQSYENRPYGLAGQEVRKALFPPSHPYHWQTIGSQEHLDAASLDDVKAFFRRYYVPNNASLAIAGDIDLDQARALVETYFGDLAPGTAVPRLQRWVPQLDGEIRLTLEDRVQLSRLYLAWPGPPRFDADEAPLDVLMAILAQGRSSRLYRSLVYDKQLVRDVSARLGAMEIAGEIRIDLTLAPNTAVAEAEHALLTELERLAVVGPTTEEVQRAFNLIEAQHVRQLESVGGFGGRANLLNYYNVFCGDPGRLNTDLDRYVPVTPEDVRRVARTYLNERRVRLLVSPRESVRPVPVSIDRFQRPAPGHPRDFRPPTPSRLRLPNGADLLVVQKHEVPAVAAGVCFEGGAQDDPAASPGLAALTGRLLIEGTQRRSSIQLADESEFIAARLNVGTQRENTVATTEVLTTHWLEALDLLADVLTNPVFPAREVERVRTERLTDLRRLRDEATAIAERVSHGLLYGRDTPAGHPISGREESLAAIPREAIVHHHASSLRQRQPTFVLVGDVEPDRVASQIADAFAAWGSGVGHASRETAVNGAGDHGSTTIYLVDKPGAAQSVIAAGQLMPSRLDADYLPLVVMNMVFGGQFTARLNMNLREDKGYTYGYRSRLDWRTERSALVAGGSVQTSVTRESISETLKEFRDLHEARPIEAEEFEKARSGLIRGYPPTFETPGQILGRLVDLVHFRLGDDYYADYVDRLSAVTLDDVRRVASTLVNPDSLCIVVVGDRAIIEPSLGELDLPIVHLSFEGDPLD